MFKKPDIYQVIVVLLSIAVIAALGLLIYNKKNGTLGKAALSIDVEHGKASVIVNKTTKAETPFYREDLYSGDIDVAVNGQANNYSTIIHPAAGTKAVIKRDLGVSKSFSSGQNIWFTKSSQAGMYVSVISPDIDAVQVVVEGVEIGKTPLKFSTKDLLSQSKDNKYKLTFKKAGYEEQEVDVKLTDGYELNIRADLFLNPIPSEVSSVSGLPSGVNFISFAKANDPAFTDRQAWAKAINYWLTTRGSVTLGNYKVEKFNFFLADTGKIYNQEGNEVENAEVKFKPNMFVAYLGSPQTADLSDEAKKSIEEATGAKVTAPAGGTLQTMIEILPNPLGYLRVRDSSSSAGKEIGKAEIGKQYTVISEKSGWAQIEYESGKQGWVSAAATYVKKIKPTK